MKSLRNVFIIQFILSASIVLSSCGGSKYQVKQYDNYALTDERFSNIDGNVSKDIGSYLAKAVSWYNSVEFDGSESQMPLNLGRDEELIAAHDLIKKEHILNIAKAKTAEAIIPAWEVVEEIDKIIEESDQTESITDSSTDTLIIVKSDAWLAVKDKLNNALRFYYENSATEKENESETEYKFPEELDMENSLEELKNYSYLMGFRSTETLKEDVTLFGKTGELVYSDYRSDNKYLMRANDTMLFYDENDEDFDTFFVEMFDSFKQLYGDPAFSANSDEVGKLPMYMGTPSIKDCAIVWKADKYTWAVLGTDYELKKVVVFWSDVYSDYGEKVSSLWEEIGDGTPVEELAVHNKPFDIDVTKNEITIIARIVNTDTIEELNSNYDLKIRMVDSSLVTLKQNDSGKTDGAWVLMNPSSKEECKTCLDAITEIYGPYDVNESDTVRNFYVWKNVQDNCWILADEAINRNQLRLYVLDENNAMLDNYK